MDMPPDFDDAMSGDVADEEPPTYQEQRDDPEEILQPASFVIRGRFIYAPPNESSPLYELSRVIHAQGAATTNIEFHRLEYRVRPRRDGTPDVSQRPKHIYNITRVPVLFTDDERICNLHSVSRKTLGHHLVLKRSPFPHSGYRATIASAEEGGTGWKRPRGQYFFWLKHVKGAYKWFDRSGKHVATQAEVGEEEGRVEYRLMVVEPLTRRMRDGLVALWCLWLWHQHGIHTKPNEDGWGKFKRIMQTPHPELPK